MDTPQLHRETACLPSVLVVVPSLGKLKKKIRKGLTGKIGNINRSGHYVLATEICKNFNTIKEMKKIDLAANQSFTYLKNTLAGLPSCSSQLPPDSIYVVCLSISLMGMHLWQVSLLAQKEAGHVHVI